MIKEPIGIIRGHWSHIIGDYRVSRAEAEAEKDIQRMSKKPIHASGDPANNTDRSRSNTFSNPGPAPRPNNGGGISVTTRPGADGAPIGVTVGPKGGQHPAIRETEPLNRNEAEVSNVIGIGRRIHRKKPVLQDLPPAPSGLSPARARLAGLATNVGLIETELTRLVSGQTRLRAELAQAERTQRKLKLRIAEDGESILQRVRSGANWALEKVAGKSTPVLDEQLRKASHEVELASHTLILTAAAIEEAEAKLHTLAEEKVVLIQDAVAEATDSFVSDYGVLVDQVVHHIVILAAREKFLSQTREGRVTGSLPDFVGPLPDQPVVAPVGAIGKATATLQRFAQALAKDPAAPVTMLEFEPVDTSPDTTTPYEALSVLERRRVDHLRTLTA